jgi:hypothetical protein
LFCQNQNVGFDNSVRLEMSGSHGSGGHYFSLSKTKETVGKNAEGDRSGTIN